MWLFALLVTLFYGVEGSIYLPQKLYGEVTSPLYPKPYPSDLETTTVITVPMGYRVKLVFWQFDVEPSEGCLYDYVKISADKQTLGRFCGQLDSPLGNPPGSKEFMSQGNKMLLTFHTDFSNEENGTIMFYKGFLAYYQAVDLDECASQPNSVEEGLQPRCQHLCHNYVGGYFCSCHPGYELQKDGQSCQAECSSELYTEPSGYVSSLEYPQPYPPDLRCNYSIRVERGLTVHLKFLDPFEIDDHQQVHCPYDQLQIYANGKNLGEFCGKQRPPDLDTSSNAVDLLFFTDESGDSRGWKLHYTTETIKCPQPKALDEFTIIQDPQPQYQFRDYFIVTCKQGYQLMEGNQALLSFTAVCQHDGTWHRAMPRCIKNCGQPQSLSNGDFRYITTKGVTTYEASIQYHCHEPYYKMLTRAGSSESMRDYRQEEPDNFEGDIALLELENSVTLGPELLPICLPDNETFYGQGLMGYVSGFGTTGNRIPFHLRFVRLPVADREACQRWLWTKKDTSPFSQNMFCSGDPAVQQDACQGDSGGVFAVRDRNRDIWVATGIVSWGIGCGEGYGFYTKVLNYVDWIKKEMGDEN
ncbi:mCG141466 [Mus musculus]|nr:mCG141466 [Mus musculus]